MGLLSTGNKYKALANQYMLEAQTLQEQQKNIDFGRNLLSNIRQQRIAAAQITASSYSDDFTTSSQAGAMANINSTLAGEVGYAYETSKRAEKVQEYMDIAQTYAKKYQKQQKKNATVGKILGSVGAIAGSYFGPLGSFVGGMAGAGLTSAMGGGRTGTYAALQGANDYGAFSGFGEWLGQQNWFQSTPVRDVSYTAASGGNVRFTNASYPG